MILNLHILTLHLIIVINKCNNLLSFIRHLTANESVLLSIVSLVIFHLIKVNILMAGLLRITSLFNLFRSFFFNVCISRHYVVGS